MIDESLGLDVAHRIGLSLAKVVQKSEYAYKKSWFFIFWGTFVVGDWWKCATFVPVDNI